MAAALAKVKDLRDQVVAAEAPMNAEDLVREVARLRSLISKMRTGADKTAAMASLEELKQIIDSRYPGTFSHSALPPAEAPPREDESAAKRRKSDSAIDERPMVFGDKRLFQVSLSDEDLRRRLAITEPYSRKSKGGEIVNCVNLTITLLGVATADEYLNVCTNRNVRTGWSEALGYMDTAMKNCGKPPDTDVDGWVPIASIPEFLSGVLPGYAAPLSVRHAGTKDWHMVMVRRDTAGEYTLIDAQTAGEDGVYPEHATGVPQIMERLGRDLYVDFAFIHGGIIRPHEVAACTTTDVPAVPVVVKRPVQSPAPRGRANDAQKNLIKAVRSKDWAQVIELSKLVPTADIALLDSDDLTSPLVYAAATGAPIDVFRALLDKGANVNFSSEKSGTALTLVTGSPGGGDAEIIKLLCSRGADPDAVGRGGRTARENLSGNPDLLKLLDDCKKKPGGRRRTRRAQNRRKTRRIR